MTFSKDSELKYTKEQILDMFELTSNDNTICPVTTIKLVKDPFGNDLTSTDEVSKTITLDSESVMTVANNVERNDTQ